MFSKTLLQPNASGTRDSSPESETSRRAEEFIKESRVKAFDPGSSDCSVLVVGKLKNGEIGIIDEFQFIEDRLARGISKVQSIYKNPEDQSLYRKLRKSGLDAAEARDSLKMMGVEPSAQTPDPATSYWGDVGYNKKKELPYFHGKRRF